MMDTKWARENTDKLPLTRAEAKAHGVRFYFTGMPCKHGHVCPRRFDNRGCVDCEVRKAREYHHKNRDRSIARCKKYKLENADKVKVYKKEYRSRNSESISAYGKSYYYDNIEKFQEYFKENWEDPAFRAQSRERSSIRGRQIRTPISKMHMNKIHEIYLEAARVTEKTGQAHHVDHIIPLRGVGVCGLHVPWNLQVLLAEENLRKGNRIEDDIKITP